MQTGLEEGEMRSERANLISRNPSQMKSKLSESRLVTEEHQNESSYFSTGRTSSLRHLGLSSAVSACPDDWKALLVFGGQESGMLSNLQRI